MNKLYTEEEYLANERKVYNQGYRDGLKDQNNHWVITEIITKLPYCQKVPWLTDKMVCDNHFYLEYDEQDLYYLPVGLEYTTLDGWLIIDTKLDCLKTNRRIKLKLHFKES